MSSLRIAGGVRLAGAITIQPSKNAAQKVLPALVAVPGVYDIPNCSTVDDNRALIDILRLLGAQVRLDGSTLRADTRPVTSRPIPTSLTRKTTGSFLFAGALLARFGVAMIGAPGGDELGPRPVNFHLDAFAALGAEWTENDDGYAIRIRHRRPATFRFPRPTANGTVNACLAAIASPGESLLANADWDPDIDNAVGLLTKAGCNIRAKRSSSGTSLTIAGGPPNGVARVTCPLVSDHNDAMTFMAAAAVAGDNVRLDNAPIEHVQPGCDLFARIGVPIQLDPAASAIEIRHPSQLHADGLDLATAPFPGLSTDWGPMIQAVLTQAAGTSYFTETLFAKRFAHVDELNKLGAAIDRTKNRHRASYRFDSDRDHHSHTLRIQGPRHLGGAAVAATDIRGGAALVVAALAATGQTTIVRAEHLRRGYERLPERLRALGAAVGPYEA